MYTTVCTQGDLSYHDTMLIDFTIEMSHQGFPLDLTNLGKHALKIIQVHRPNFTKFGKNWVQTIRVLEVELLNHCWGVDFSMGEPHVVQV